MVSKGEIPRYIVNADGAVYGAYLTEEHAEEIKARIEKKGFSNVHITNNPMDWLMPEPEEVKSVKKGKKK